MVSKSLVHFCFLSSKEVLLTYIFSKYSNSDLKMGGIRCFGIAILVLLGFLGSTQAQLQLGFYSKNCPKAEKIIQDFVNQHIHNAPSLAAAFIRMHFHDCFIRVCVNSFMFSYELFSTLLFLAYSSLVFYYI